MHLTQITIADLKFKACKALGLEEGDVRIWDYWNMGRHALLESRMDETAQAAKIFDNQDIFLEEKVRVWCWPAESTALGIRCIRVLPRLALRPLCLRLAEGSGGWQARGRGR